MSDSILCFGDSNTYGLKPNPYPWTRQRWGREERWPTILRALTGFDVVEEGLPGRTATSINRSSTHLDAMLAVPMIMESHTPVDTVIIMLGTNDLQSAFALSPEAITIAVSGLVRAVRQSDRLADTVEPQILVISPPPVEEIGFRSVTFEGAAEKSRKFAPLYQRMATALGAKFLDAQEVCRVSETDGIHLSSDDHHALATAVKMVLTGNS